MEATLTEHTHLPPPPPRPPTAQPQLQPQRAVLRLSSPPQWPTSGLVPPEPRVRSPPLVRPPPPQRMDVAAAPPQPAAGSGAGPGSPAQPPGGRPAATAWRERAPLPPELQQSVARTMGRLQADLEEEEEDAAARHPARAAREEREHAEALRWVA